MLLPVRLETKCRDVSKGSYNESESVQIFCSNICHLKYLELEKMRGEVHILVYCPIDTLQWGSTHSALDVAFLFIRVFSVFVITWINV